MDFLNKYFNFDDNNITYGLTNELICFYVLECFRRKKKNTNRLIKIEIAKANSLGYFLFCKKLEEI